MLKFSTERLYLREMTQNDFPALSRILRDPEVMYAYEGAFTEAETQAWLDNQFRRYAETGMGLWAVCLKETDDMIGQCGLTLQQWKELTLTEVGYLFQKAYWHQGYAAEAARGCRDFAFETMDIPAVCSIIRDTNRASQKVAERNGMKRMDSWVKHYHGADMPHFRYEISRADWEKLTGG